MFSILAKVAPSTRCFDKLWYRHRLSKSAKGILIYTQRPCICLLDICTFVMSILPLIFVNKKKIFLMFFRNTIEILNFPNLFKMFYMLC